MTKNSWKQNMIEEVSSEPTNPKLKDQKAFATACADVSSLLKIYFSFNFLLFRYWYHNACVKNGPSQRVRFVDRQTRVLLSTCHRQSQGIYTKFLSSFDDLVVTLSFDELFFYFELVSTWKLFFLGFFVKLGDPFRGQTNPCLNFSCHKTEQWYF